jgi:hypothetical protein
MPKRNYGISLSTAIGNLLLISKRDAVYSTYPPNLLDL